MRSLALFVSLAMALPAQAGPWFLHAFGELRAYHGDWLAVCDDDGAGPCRLVFSAADLGSGAYFDTRVSLHRIEGSPDWAIEIMDRGMDAEAVEEIRVTIDAESFDLPLRALIIGDLDTDRVLETLTVVDAQVAANLLEAMRKGNRMHIRYTPEGSGDGGLIVPLRGVTAGTRAIEARVLARQE